MESRVDFTYSLTELELLPLNQSYPSAVRRLSDIISDNIDPDCNVTDVYNCFSDDDVSCAIDMDFLERLYAERNGLDPDSSMDLGFTVTKNDGCVEFVLVELKLNVCNPRNVKMVDMDHKIDGSRKHITNCAIHDSSFFIFADNRVDEARSHFTRLHHQHKYNPSRKAFSLTQLREMFFRLTSA